MASHMTFSRLPTTDRGDNNIRNLVDIATVLARNTDPSLRVEYSGMKASEIFPHFTSWRQLSIEQKAKTLDLLLDFYERSVQDPEQDVSATTDQSFIGSSSLRKKSAEFSSKLVEGSVVLREKTEDKLGFYFMVDIDKLGAYGGNSRELARYIEYRVPHIYRDDHAMNEHCRLFANAIASVVLERANLTPIRRKYTGTFKTSYRLFTLRNGAEVPYEAPPVELTRDPIEWIHVEIAPQPTQGNAPPAAPTAPNNPETGQNPSGGQSRSSFGSDMGGIDFSSEEVQRALDEAEARANGSIWLPRTHVTAIIKDNESTVGSNGSETSSTLTESSISQNSSVTAAGGAPSRRAHRSSGVQAGSPIFGPQNVTPIRSRAQGHYTSTPVVHPLGSVGQTVQHGVGVFLPARYMLFSAPSTPETPNRHAQGVTLTGQTIAISQDPIVLDHPAGEEAFHPNRAQSPFVQHEHQMNSSTPQRGRQRGTHRTRDPQYSARPGSGA